MLHSRIHTHAVLIHCVLYMLGLSVQKVTRTESSASALPCGIAQHILYAPLCHDYSLGLESWCEEEGVGRRKDYAAVRQK